MRTHTRKLLVASTAFLILSAPAVASTKLNGNGLNGIRLNGIRVNGVKLNGVKLNGVKLNGNGLNGTQFDSFSGLKVLSVELAH